MSWKQSVGGDVKVIHGANDGVFALAGEAVCSVRASLVDAFNIPADAISFVNGEQVDMGYSLAANDTLEFCKQNGNKGGRKMLTKTDISREYTGFPDDVMNELFATLRHDDVSADGEHAWYEKAVDKWLDKRYSRKRADDGRDKVIPPYSVRIDGRVYDGLTRTEWHVLEIVCSKVAAGKPGATFDEIIEHVWGHDTDWKDEALKQHIKRLNGKLADQGCRASIHGENRFVAISK